MAAYGTDPARYLPPHTSQLATKLSRDGGCRAEGCDRRSVHLGYCEAHYKRLQVHGDVRAHVPLRVPLPRGGFWDKARIGRPEDCWPWQGATTVGGCARYRKVYAHRVAYELAVGPIPVGLQVDHLCRNRACVNPRHLEPVTPRENTYRSTNPTARNRLKTHCIHGHALTPSNTYLRPGGGRTCRRCAADSGTGRRAAA